jgi:histidyl-tRNA synthetase
VLIGKNEIKERTVTVRNLHTGEQERLGREGCIAKIETYFKVE